METLVPQRFVTFGGGGCKLKTQCLCENYPHHHKVSPCHPESTSRHPEALMCHPGGFLDGRRVNESEPSPVSEQIEHTKTECLYAKLCEREGNPRQLVSGSYQPTSLVIPHLTGQILNTDQSSQNSKA